MSEGREPLRGLPSAYASEDTVIRMHRFQAAWPELDFVPPSRDGSRLWVCLRDGQRFAARLLLAHLLDDVADLMGGEPS